MGALVRETDNIVSMFGSNGHSPRIGHVVGLDTNCHGEVIPVIQWANPYRQFGCAVEPNPPVPINAFNIELYTD